MRLIDADAVKFNFQYGRDDNGILLVPYRDAKKLIEAAKTVDAVPVVHGRWEYIQQTLNTLSQLRCSFCGWWSLDPSIDGAYNYCPNCGAKMDGGEDR